MLPCQSETEHNTGQDDDADDNNDDDDDDGIQSCGGVSTCGVVSDGIGGTLNGHGQQ